MLLATTSRQTSSAGKPKRVAPAEEIVVGSGGGTLALGNRTVDLRYERAPDPSLRSSGAAHYVDMPSFVAWRRGGEPEPWEVWRDRWAPDIGEGHQLAPRL